MSAIGDVAFPRLVSAYSWHRDATLTTGHPRHLPVSAISADRAGRGLRSSAQRDPARRALALAMVVSWIGAGAAVRERELILTLHVTRL